MGRLKEKLTNIILDNISRISLNKSINNSNLTDKYIGPFLLMRIYDSTVTIYYLERYDRVIIPKIWFDLFEDIDILQGENIIETSEPSDDIEKFIYLFFKFSRGVRMKFSYNTDGAARLLLTELYKLGTTNFINFLDSSCGIKLKPWEYDKIDSIISI